MVIGVSTRTADDLPRTRVQDIGDQRTDAPVADLAGTLGATYTSACKSTILNNKFGLFWLLIMDE